MSYTLTGGGTIIQGWSGSNPITLQMTLDTTITDPSIITTITGNAFLSNTFNLTGLLFFNSIKTIGGLSYKNQTGIVGLIQLPTSLETIQSEAFYGCTGLNGTLTLPASLTAIGTSAFYGCTGFTGDLILPTGLITLGNAAFLNCTGFTTLKIPPLTLNAATFQGCTGLTSVYFQSGCTLQNNAFSNSTTAIVYAYQGNVFTIGAASGSFSTTINPLSSFFSKWRLYNQPYPTPNDFFNSSTNTFYSQFTPNDNFTFYTYNVTPTNYTVVVKDVNGAPVTITTPIIITSGYLYTFTINLPSNSKTITLDNYGLVLNLTSLACSSFANLNDSYTVGEPILITWTGTSPPYTLSYSDSSLLQIVIVTSFGGNAFPFTIPYTSASTAVFEVVDANNCSTTSESFSINPCITIDPMEPNYTDFITVSWAGFNPLFTVTLIGEDGSEQVMGATGSNTLTWGITTFTTAGFYQVQVSDINGCTVLSNTFLIISLQDICFVKDTLVETDQGNIPIQFIVPGKHTVFNQKIIDLTKTIHPDSHLVHIKAFSFGTYPTKDTTVSREHKINGVGSFREARHYVNGSTVTLVPYDYQPLYNVLLIRPGFMRVHGMMVETLDPYVMKHQPKRPLLKR